MDKIDKGMIHALGEMKQNNHKILLCCSEQQAMENLWIVYFSNFLFNIFRLGLTVRN